METKSEKAYVKGYLGSVGYFGWIGNRYQLFATENDYLEYMHEKEID